jgi:hypothetical protein
MRVEIALKEEDDYFRKHPVYSSLPREALGTRALVEKLSSILFKHIRTYLPKIMEEIDTKAFECEDKLRRLGPTLPAD